MLTLAATLIVAAVSRPPVILASDRAPAMLLVQAGSVGGTIGKRDKSAVGHPRSAGGKLDYSNILGKWCGEITDYTFSRTALTVHFHDGSAKRVLKVKKYAFSDTWINAVWGFGGNTVFGEFSANGKAMAQQPNTSGDKGPRRPFHRC